MAAPMSSSGPAGGGLPIIPPRQMQFDLPERGLVQGFGRDSTILRPEGADYVEATRGNSVFRLRIPAAFNSHFDPKSAVICFDLKFNTNVGDMISSQDRADQDGAVYLDPECGAYGLFSRITLGSGKSLIEDVQHYDYVTAYLNRILGRRQTNQGMQYCMTGCKSGSNPFGGGLTRGYGDNFRRDRKQIENYRNLVDALAAKSDGEDFTTSYCVPLLGLGLFSDEHFLPTEYLRELELTLTLNAIEQFAVKVNSNFTTADTYTVRNLRLECDFYSYPESIAKNMTQKLDSGASIVLRLPAFDLDIHAVNIPNGNPTTPSTYYDNYRLTRQLSSVKALFVYWMPQTANKYFDQVTRYAYVDPGSLVEFTTNENNGRKGGLVQFQIQAGSKSIPEFPMTEKKQFLNSTIKAANQTRMGDLNIDPFAVTQRIVLNGTDPNGEDAIQFLYRNTDTNAAGCGEYGGTNLIRDDAYTDGYRDPGGKFTVGIMLRSYPSQDNLLNGTPLYGTVILSKFSVMDNAGANVVDCHVLIYYDRIIVMNKGGISEMH